LICKDNNYFSSIKPYDQTAEASIVVKNTGKVRLQFNEIGYDESNIGLEPDKPFLLPATVKKIKIIFFNINFKEIFLF
jgi:hypothetical protein